MCRVEIAKHTAREKRTDANLSVNEHITADTQAIKTQYWKWKIRKYANATPKQKHAFTTNYERLGESTKPTSNKQTEQNALTQLLAYTKRTASKNQFIKMSELGVHKHPKHSLTAKERQTLSRVAKAMNKTYNEQSTSTLQAHASKQKHRTRTRRRNTNDAITRRSYGKTHRNRSKKISERRHQQPRQQTANASRSPQFTDKHTSYEHKA